MIGTTGGLLELQAILILKSFATHVLPSRAVGLPRAFCDIVGIVRDGIIIGVKLRQSVLGPLTPEDVGIHFVKEIALMKNCTGKEPVQIELWVALSRGRWQFFEITREGVREVEHAARP